MRGEDHLDDARRFLELGSPPHARGRRMGDTIAQKISVDHPRMRGEDDDGEPVWLKIDGSPPHARGRPTGRRANAGTNRITPACAGKTKKERLITNEVEDHPRMRGEDSLLTQKYHESCRITPACAGKTLFATASSCWVTDHPRMRGEDSFSSCRGSLSAGSPPHARGRRKPTAPTMRAARITPACAGKTAATCSTPWCTGDHPRMRGEDTGRLRSERPLHGSPPHARGRRRADGHLRPAAGITPACAGKTVPDTFDEVEGEDHPRMRGEDRLLASVSHTVQGSPPHARGRH